ncbi:hypothetical protein [Streptomyces sp. NPDC088847]|uniref:hypothetical protein n=1 Tax=Streptomyces sp. NPDC088847 TaxID=3365909 RepID=UPI0038213AC9
MGGPLGSGRDFLGPFFDTDGTFRREEPQRLYREFLDTLDVRGLAALSIPLVCTFGLSAHTVATRQNWDLYRDRHGTVADTFLDSRLFADLVRATVRGALAFYDHAVALGLRVLAPLPPQRVPGTSDPDVFFAAQDIVVDELNARGVELIDLRSRVADADGLQRPAFCKADDTIHGNLAFGRLVLSELLDRGL